MNIRTMFLSSTSRASAAVGFFLLLIAACSNETEENRVGDQADSSDQPSNDNPTGQTGRTDVQPDEAENSHQTNQSDQTDQEAQGRVARQVQQLTLDLEPVVKGNNEFAFSLYQKIIDSSEVKEQNLFISPFSVSAALAMTYAGADGETAREMSDVMVIKTEDSAFHTEFGAVIRDLSGEKPGRGYQLFVAGRLFGGSDSEFYEEFLEINQQNYDAPLEQVNFCGDPEAARATINDWVAAQTKDKIKELFPEGQFDCNTALTLVNAIYFKADWAQRFDSTSTADRPFRLLSGETVSVATMSGEIDMRKAETADLTLLDLSYQDGELSMIILLPNEPDGLPTLESSLELDRIEQLIDSATESESLIELPRFEIRSKPNVKQALIDMGMASAFDANIADFSKMSDMPALFIDDVVHQAFVSVDEEGTEAAAATGVEMTFKAAPLPIQVDHPFLFMIRDRLTHSILFMGRVLDPSQASR
ncbi:MAG: serpin family protein [Deltaproteobacteria bacterium]|nr:serpin family protein [Deltaproteobacteria bacterium]